MLQSCRSQTSFLFLVATIFSHQSLVKETIAAAAPQGKSQQVTLTSWFPSICFACMLPTTQIPLQLCFCSVCSSRTASLHLGFLFHAPLSPVKPRSTISRLFSLVLYCLSSLQLCTVYRIKHKSLRRQSSIHPSSNNYPYPTLQPYHTTMESCSEFSDFHIRFFILMFISFLVYMNVCLCVWLCAHEKCLIKDRKGWLSG